VYAYTGLILDSAGYDTVLKKKDWIRSLEAAMRMVMMAPIPETNVGLPVTLESRKVEWK
jgi:hypothetical protein